MRRWCCCSHDSASRESSEASSDESDGAVGALCSGSSGSDGVDGDCKEWPAAFISSLRELSFFLGSLLASRPLPRDLREFFLGIRVSALQKPVTGCSTSALPRSRLATQERASVLGSFGADNSFFAVR